MSDPDPWTEDDWLSYYHVMLRLAWETKTASEVKRLRKRDSFLVEAIEGIMSYDRR